MSDNVKEEVLLVGLGYMGKEYHKVLAAMDIPYVAVGRSEQGAKEFEEITGHKAYFGGIDKYIEENGMNFRTAIMAVQAHYACECAVKLFEAGVKRLLVEKPGALTREQMDNIVEVAEKNGAKVVVAYNRRHYASVLAAEKIIREDGGVTSFKFDFTEIRLKDGESTEELLVANSSHVIDLAFWLGGVPKKILSFNNIVNGKKMRIEFAGAGISEQDALFSYSANWCAPGRWNVEVMTPLHRLIFSPMEKLQVQCLGSFAVNEAEVDYTIDTEFKPGIYREVEMFLNDIDNPRLLTMQQQRDHMEYYIAISRGNCQ